MRFTLIALATLLVSITASGASTYMAKDFVNARSCASTSCDVVEVLRPNQLVDVVDASSAWYEIRLNGMRYA